MKLKDLKIKGSHETKNFGTDIVEIREKLEMSWPPPTNAKMEEIVAIGINPSKAGKIVNAEPIRDRTVSMLAAFLNDNGFCKCTMINLFECVTPEQGNIDQRAATDFKKHEDLLSSAGIILIIWGLGNNYVEQKKELFEILMKYNNKLYCIKDKQGKYPRHPSRMSYDSEIVKCKIDGNMNLILE